MNYEQKYKEALERAKGAHNSAKSDKENGIIDKITEYTIQLTETIFPELKESEDEQIKKRIIQSLHGDVLDMEETNKAIAWLERQSEQIDIANKEYWRGYREGKQEILDKYAELEKQQQAIEIPFGAKDSELQEATYHIPEGYHAEINGNAVVIKKGEIKSCKI